MLKVLFVCLGNICRSPMAEGIFKDLIQKYQLGTLLACDSAGTSGYHIGEAPDERMCETAKKHEIILQHRARKFMKADFDLFDYIIVMDKQNYNFVREMRQKIPHKPRAAIFLMRSFPQIEAIFHEDVPDPYYGSMQDFEQVFQILQQSSLYFLRFLAEKHQLPVRITLP